MDTEPQKPPVTQAVGVKENPGKKRQFVDVSDVLWVMAFIFVVHKFDLIDAVRYDSRVHR